MKSLFFINTQKLQDLSNTKSIQMNQMNMIYNQFSDESNSNFFGSSYDDDFDFACDQQEIFGRLQNNCPITSGKPNGDIPFEFDSRFNNFYVKSQMNNYNQMHSCFDDLKDEEHQEISSVDGEKEFQPKVSQRKTSNETNSTIELESAKANKDSSSYDSLFKLIEDKNMYEIGSGDDKLNTSNNVELLKLDKILSDSDTDLNIFIGDMLKNCPCDTLVKKQRIYKAKNIKRRRKTKSQIKQLEKEFKGNSAWSKDDIKRLSKTL